MLNSQKVFFNVVESSDGDNYKVEEGFRTYMQNVGKEKEKEFMGFMKEITNRVLYSITSIKDFDPYIMSQNINSEIWQ